MRFRKGGYYPHPPRGPGRHEYRLTDAALRARRENLAKCRRLRSRRETEVIKLLIWQAYFEQWPRPTQRALARQFCVSRSYVQKIQRQRAKGMQALTNAPRTTLDDLEQARRFTAGLKGQEPGLLRRAPEPGPADEPAVMTADESIAATWREVNEWKRKNLRYARACVRCFVLRR